LVATPASNHKESAGSGKQTAKPKLAVREVNIDILALP
jgi:hypothetical protein